MKKLPFLKELYFWTAFAVFVVVATVFLVMFGVLDDFGGAEAVVLSVSFLTIGLLAHRWASSKHLD